MQKQRNKIKYLKVNPNYGFTTTSEKQNESSFSVSSSAVGAKLRRGFTTPNEGQSERSRSVFLSAGVAKPSMGFTLIELLVSLTLFTVVIVMAVGTLLVLIDANTKAQNMQEAMTNLTFALDSMTREIRTGSGYYCDNSGAFAHNKGNDETADCWTGDRSISIVEGGSSLTEYSGGNRITYRLNTGSTVIERKIGNGSWLPITSDALEIEEMKITVRNSDTFSSSSNTLQPTVTIYIRGKAGTLENVDTSFSIQTTITRRIRDL